MVGLSDCPIPVVEDIALWLSRGFGLRGVDLRNFALTARRYTEPAQKALLDVVHVVPGCQLEALTAFIDKRPWAAHAVHRLVMPSRQDEIAYISGRAAFNILRLAAHVSDLNIGLPAGELLVYVTKYRNGLRKLRLVKLDLTCADTGARTTPAQREQAALDFVASSATTLREVRIAFGAGTRFQALRYDNLAHADIIQSPDPFVVADSLKFRKLRKLVGKASSAAIIARIAGASPALRELHPPHIEAVSAL